MRQMTVKKDDHYAVLDVPKNADSETIQRAFNALKLLRNEDSEFQKKLENAFLILSNPEKRAQYHREMYLTDWRNLMYLTPYRVVKNSLMPGWLLVFFTDLEIRSLRKSAHFISSKALQPDFSIWSMPTNMVCTHERIENALLDPNILPPELRNKTDIHGTAGNEASGPVTFINFPSDSPVTLFLK